MYKPQPSDSQSDPVGTARRYILYLGCDFSLSDREEKPRKKDHWLVRNRILIPEGSWVAVTLTGEGYFFEGCNTGSRSAGEVRRSDSYLR